MIRVNGADQLCAYPAAWTLITSPQIAMFCPNDQKTCMLYMHTVNCQLDCCFKAAVMCTNNMRRALRYIDCIVLETGGKGRAETAASAWFRGQPGCCTRGCAVILEGNSQLVETLWSRGTQSTFAGQALLFTLQLWLGLSLVRDIL